MPQVKERWIRFDSGVYKLSEARDTPAVTGASIVTVGLVPVYAVLVGITVKNVTAITGTLATYDIGDGTDVDRWGAAIPKTINNRTGWANYTNLPGETWVPVAAAREVTLTANGGTFTSGTIEILSKYITIGHN